VSELTLRRKLFLAGQEAEAVEKNGDSEDGGYKYAKAKDVLAEANRVLEKHGLVVLPSTPDAELRFLKGGGVLAKVSMEFEICDSEGDETILKEWRGTGFDRLGDKAIYAAITGAKKYFFASLLNIPFGVDPEGGEPTTSPEARRIAAEQDRDAEQPDVPTGQESDQSQVAPACAPHPADSGTAAEPATDPAPADEGERDLAAELEASK
jgi:hypothetical protein